MRVLAPLVLLVALAGCSNDAGEVSSAYTGEWTVATPDTYASVVDGLSATWPAGWHRALKPLNPGNSGHIELLALTTFEDPRSGDCSPYPDAAMAAMTEGDAVFVLWTTLDPIHDQPPRPKDLMAAARRRPAGQPPVQAECFPTGAEARLASFREHGRHYEAFIAARTPVSDHRRREIQQIWSQLKLRPIEMGLEVAELGRPYWHLLNSHCGIGGTRFDGRDWIADPLLSDGQGNPPRWKGAIPGGTITLTEENVAVYENRGGKHTARFRPRRPDEEPFSCSA